MKQFTGNLMHHWLKARYEARERELWDSASVIEGHQEIWYALWAAAVAAESLHFQLAKTILDGTNTSVPNNFFTECYEKLGTRY